jgi:exoribonuclease R
MTPFSPVEEYIEEVDVMAPMTIDTFLDNHAIAEVIKAHSVRNRIACGRLRKVAKELGLPSNKLGAIAKEYNIKIVACELGCF